jgi:hypothetical protein
MHLPRMCSPARLLAAALALAACTQGTEPRELPFEVRVENGGAVELRSVVVYVSESDSLRVATLAAGAASGYAPADARPHVRVLVDGAGAQENELSVSVRRE